MASVTGIAYVRYRAPDLDAMERFFVDFGLVKAHRTPSALYMRGSGEDPYIHVTELGAEAGIGLGLRVGSLADLRSIASQAGVPIEDSPEPGGGQRATLYDPNGFRVDLIFGQKLADPLPTRAPLTLNDSRRSPRKGTYQRPSKGASHVARLEHSVLAGPNFEAALDFYRDLLGMKISDRIHAGDPAKSIAIFLHCGLGEQYTDHHTIALMRNPETAIDHVGFVVLDWDDLMLGHQHLKAAGHFHDWGIGRHIMGSEIFDYWRDPYGNKVEHCIDGDLVNDDHEPVNVSVQDDILSVWSPPLSSTFALLNPREPNPPAQ